MIKDDEKALLEAIQQGYIKDKSFTPSIQDLIIRLGINDNRAEYILEKWTDRGWYNYGVNVFYGWLEDKGKRIKIENGISMECINIVPVSGSPILQFLKRRFFGRMGVSSTRDII